MRQRGSWNDADTEAGFQGKTCTDRKLVYIVDMGKRGPEKQFEARLELRIDAATIAMLDKLRGAKSRSEAIRELIRDAIEREG